MKKLQVILISIFLICSNLLFSQDQEKSEPKLKGGVAQVPSAKRPKPIDTKKAQEAALKDENDKTVENNKKTIRYGMSSEIATLLDDLIKNDDPRFTDEIYDLFLVTKNSSIKEKVLYYFAKIEDPCLEDFAVDLLNDPYDEKNDVVKATFNYIAAVKTKDAIPAVITLIETENEVYFNDAVITLGEIGSSEEAMFLAEYLERDDLSIPQRQTVMRVCGKMHDESTWGRLVDIIEDEDENLFVKMYAAEAIGLMEVDKSIPVLERNFDASDPNLRQYVIKGLSNFPNSPEAKSLIMQGIRDDHWKVRQESIRSASKMQLKEAVPFLIHRAQNDSEKVIKEESYKAIAALNTQEGNTFLIEQLQDKKLSDQTKIKIVESLMKDNYAGEKEILQIAEETLIDDKRKPLRYAIGKELAKRTDKKYADICAKFLSSKDPTTISLGLDMYKNGKYSSAEDLVRTIANDKKANASNKKRAMKILGIEETLDAK